MENTKFYQFSQNNSGGQFTLSDKDGICEYVIIEACNAAQANSRAEEIGIYFDGCSTGSDCLCCGDRWYKVDETDGNKVPSLYDTPLQNTKQDYFRKKCFVHYLDGKVEEVTFTA